LALPAADRRTGLGLAAVLFLAGAAVACRSTSSPASVQRVQLTRVEPRDLPNAVTYQATVDAIDEIAMTPEIDGRIVAMPMREGQFVKAGTLLYKLDQRPLESQAKADLAVAENARLNAIRYVRANFAGAVSNKESDDYAAQARQSQEVYRSRRALLAYKEVRAPFDGQLGAIRNKLGDYVAAGTAVTSLIDNRRLWISLDVPAALAYRVKLGMPVRLKAPGLPADQALARVTFIAPELDVQRQTLLVQATIDNPSRVLRHKQRLEASLVLGSTERITIPAAATQVQAGQTFVYLAQPTERQRYRLQLRPVRLGAPVHEQFPVLSGLQPGEQGVVGDLSALSNGLTVEAGRPLP
jgi:RND family efflux transporter MFP subunit